ncbi:MAG: acyl-CoA dehydrogenase family protein [Chloroflexota bacterium]|nr:acyl-CoA dehydrogenase family protein [Chloroflexota bacterium]
MDYSFSEEQTMFCQMFADFVAKEIEPRAEHIDEQEKLPATLLEKSAMQGFLGALLPEDYFGADLDPLSYILMLEEVAKSCMSTAVVLHVHNSLVSKALLLFGTEEQKETWLPAMAEGSTIGAWAAYEPDSSSLKRIQTTADPINDSYRLDGLKVWVSNAKTAGLFVLFASTPEGPTAFLVPADAKGLKLGLRDKTLGMRGVQVHPVYLDDVFVGSDQILGKPGEAAKIVETIADFSKLALAAIALGGAEHALELGVQFAVERKQFGSEIAHKGAIQAFIADSALEVETLRSHVYRCASLASQGNLDSEVASIAKLWANRVAYQVANRMIQTHGGYGYINDYPISRVFRDCRTIEVVEGGNRSQQTAIARSILADHGLEIA